MAASNTYSETPGRPPVWIENMGDPRGREGLEVRNTLQVDDLADSVSLQVQSEVVGTWAPCATTQVSVRISDSDARRLRDRLDEILNKPGRG